jgi:uncharacterized protein
MDKNNDYIKNIDGAERRFIQTGGSNAPQFRFEKRADGTDYVGAVIEGYAALFNKPADLGWYIEEIDPAFFDDVLNDDVKALFNHDPNFILARSNAGKGTLTISVDKTGLKYSYATPDYSYAIDLAKAIENGDVSQSSFGFSVSESEWIFKEGEQDRRILKKAARLYDVSPVTYPAYADTTVAKRSATDANKQIGAPPTGHSLAMLQRKLTIVHNN